MAGIFGELFSGLRLPRNEARKVLEKFGENSEQNSGQNSGQKFEKFGELSFCKFSDLKLFGELSSGFLRTCLAQTCLLAWYQVRLF